MQKEVKRMVGEVDERPSKRMPVPTRKVVMPEGRKIVTGIYNHDGTPAAAIAPGSEYRAKFNRVLYPVVARADGFMDWRGGELPYARS